MSRGGVIRKFILYCSGLAFTSFLATLATLPFTISLFHRFSLHAIESNLVVVPLTSLVIMPSAFLACLLSPLGLEAGPLWVFEHSITYLMQIAKTVGSWPGANMPVAQPTSPFLPLVVGGALWICLWQHPWRKWGLIPLCGGLLLMFWSNPPHILIDGQGKVVALNQERVLYINSIRKGKFTAQTWAKQLGALEIRPLSCEGEVCHGSIADTPVVISSSAEDQPCVKDAILIRLEPSQKACPSAALVVDWFDLWRGGSHAIRLTSHGPQVEKVRKRRGFRPWEKQPRSRKKELPSLSFL